jgi:uncharacterized protein (DUF302 family)
MTTTATTPYGFGVTVPLDHEEALDRVKTALAQEGFGILCEIDVAETFKKKLGVEFLRYVILGACNPPLAHRALLTERDLGLFLPCNVIVYADAESQRTVISAMDPVVAFELTGNAALESVADEVRERLVRALDALERSAANG